MLSLYAAAVGAAAPAAPYQISATQLYYDQSHHTITYTGNVTIRQGHTTLTGERVLIHYDHQNQIESITAEGEHKLAHYHTLQTHTDHTAPSALDADANIIEFHPLQHRAILKHSAKITQDKNVFSGDFIIYDTQTHTVEAHGNGQSQTHMLIQPHLFGKNR